MKHSLTKLDFRGINMSAMNVLNENSVCCPYCGELNDVLVECSGEDQEYIEDCQVCCRPIVFNVLATMSGDLALSVHSEDECF